MAKKGMIIGALLAFLLSAVTTHAALLNNPVVDLLWTTDVFDGDEVGVKNLSVTFVGSAEIPLLLYSRANPTYRVFMAHPATNATEKTCGPGGGWTCRYLNPSYYPYEGVLSDVVSETGDGIATLAYAFQTENKIYVSVFRQEFNQDMTLGVSEVINIIDLMGFGGIHYELAGVPSLILDGDHYKIAAVVRNPDTNQSKLVYAYYNPGTASPCDTGSDYQCDVVTTLTGVGSSPSLAEVNGTAGIAYYDPATDDLMYAYPHSHTTVYPSNCGPGNPKTYRCITVYSADEVGADVQMAFGSTTAQRAIAFTRDYSEGHYLYNAEYVGRYGNCGSDLDSFGNSVLKWKCTRLNSLDYNPTPS